MASMISCTAFCGTSTGAFAVSPHDAFGRTAPARLAAGLVTRRRDAAIDGVVLVDGATGPRVWSPPV